MPKNSGSGLGRALIKAKLKQKKRTINSVIPACPEKKLTSVLEMNSLDSFLENAELAQRQFESEKNVIIVEKTIGPTAKPSISRSVPLRIPRRPEWNKDMKPNELLALEKASFLEWRKEIAEIEATNTVDSITPFEKNLDVWRELWRTLERSDVIVEILDSRNPLIYRNDDLETYIKSLNKDFVLLLNKSDFLDDEKRLSWSKYFIDNNIKCIFVSAINEQDKLDANVVEEAVIDIIDYGSSADPNIRSHMLNRNELLEYFNLYRAILAKESITIGMVGYPNVGKSSLINVIYGVKKNVHGVRVAVGCTPGKTKHVQTLKLSDDITLCDCPGLVFPSFVNTKSDLILNGILSISQIRDPYPPLELLCQLITRKQFEDTYNIKLPVQLDDTEETYVSVPQLMEKYCTLRGYMASTHSGIDIQKGCRTILKDFLSGKLLYAASPPNELTN